MLQSTNDHYNQLNRTSMHPNKIESHNSKNPMCYVPKNFFKKYAQMFHIFFFLLKDYKSCPLARGKQLNDQNYNNNWATYPIHQVCLEIPTQQEYLLPISFTKGPAGSLDHSIGLSKQILIYFYNICQMPWSRESAHCIAKQTKPPATNVENMHQ